MNSRPLIIFGIVVLLVIGAAVWFLQTKPPTPDEAIVATPPPIPVATPQAFAPQTTPPPNLVPRAATPTPQTPPPVRAEPEAIPAWELKIDSILKTNAGETETAQMLINLLPTLPPEGQAEAAQHISNLILDKDYSRVLPLLRNPTLPEEVQDVLVTDLMNRDDAVKLPALLDIAKILNHPYHDEALTDLQIFLDADEGVDWSKWDKDVKTYLKKQADENGDAK